MGRRQVRFCQTWGPRLLSPHCLYPTLCDPMDCSPPGCSLCPWGFSRQKYWSGLPSPPQGIFQTQELNQGLLHCRWILHRLNYQGSPHDHQMSSNSREMRPNHIFSQTKRGVLILFSENVPRGCLAVSVLLGCDQRGSLKSGSLQGCRVVPVVVKQREPAQAQLEGE